MHSDWKENEIVEILRDKGFYLYSDHEDIVPGTDTYVRFNIDGSEEMVKTYLDDPESIEVLKIISEKGLGRYMYLLNKV